VALSYGDELLPRCLILSLDSGQMGRLSLHKFCAGRLAAGMENSALSVAAYEFNRFKAD
jgi:hypothetical protein